MSNLPDLFVHHLQLRTRFSDVDMLGHVNNAVYLTFLEEARVHYARDVLNWDGEPDHMGMIVAKCTIDYLLPLRAGEEIAIFTRCSRIGRKSFDFTYFIARPDQEQLVATALTTMVAFDYRAGRSILFPEPWRMHILAFETHAPEEA
ncbi:MAG: acyl-CoA thioesterase [Anaerolineae bacterium]|nr:acyl-CoA thioesterase [Anaerolineae bacterium]